MKLFSSRNILCLFTSILLLANCNNPTQPEETEDEVGIPDEEIADNSSVPADQTLETVTWNIQWYGDGTYGEEGNNGPIDEVQQTKNVLKVADSLKADLYAFQEIYNQKALNDITENMSGYTGFVADHINCCLRTSFVYNTNTIDSLSAGAITAEEVRQEYQDDWSYNWANGRLPMYFNFTYNYNNTTTDFFAIVIHAKAHTGDSSEEFQDAYERRKRAAEGLYYYLKDHKPNAKIVFLGDYNDDVDESLYYRTEDNYAQTPYYQFVDDSENFNVVSSPLSENKTSTVGYDDVIDHITISDELFSMYLGGSSAVFQPSSDFISNYEPTTSDHYPVWAKFDITK